MTTLPVDDRDPSISYSGDWGQNSDHLAYNNTLTSLGGTAKISFVGELYNAFQRPHSQDPAKGSSIGVYSTHYAKFRNDGTEGPPAPTCLHH